AGWQRVRAAVDRLGAREGRVGVFEGNIAKIATVHEFGAPSAGIPERSYMRSALQTDSAEVAKVQTVVAGRVLEGKLDENRALAAIGVLVRDLFKRRILEQPTEWPPLKPATSKRKGSRKNKILINTGQLIGSIIYKIVGR